MRTILALFAVVASGQAVLAQDEPQADPRKDEIKNKLNTLKVTIDFTDAPLDDVINYFRDATDLNFHVDPEVHDKLTDDQRKVTIKLKDVMLKSALKLILSSRDLTAVYKEGVLIIQHKDKAAAATVKLQVYDVRDLLLKIEDFPGPKTELVATEKINGFNPIVEPEPRDRMNEEFIVEMVKAATGDKSWEQDSNVSVSLANGLLVVTQSKRVHEEIMRLISLLREFK